jgi:hypothetical protein
VSIVIKMVLTIVTGTICSKASTVISTILCAAVPLRACFSAASRSA